MRLVCGGLSMRLLLVLIAFVAAPAFAAPIYLQCSFAKAEGPPFVLAVTADEANGSVTTLATHSGFSERLTAVFSPTSVKWSTFKSYGGLRYELSRTDLTLVRELVVGENVTRDAGTCKIQEVPKRAF